MRDRTTLNLDTDIVKLARMHAASTGQSLSDVVEESLKGSLPSSINVQMTGDPKEMSIEFVSTPSIARMKPTSSLEDIK